MKFVSGNSIGIQAFAGTSPCPEKMEPIVNESWVKPAGGLWTSTYNGTSSDWLSWCKAEAFSPSSNTDWKMHLLTPTEDSRLLVIETLADLEEIYDIYPDVEATYKCVLDFERLADICDGIHLTEEGQWNTRFGDRGRIIGGLDLYGWDCESTLWFRWSFKEC